MSNKKTFWLILLFVILSLQFIFAASISNVQSSQFVKGASEKFDATMCQEGKDFLIQIAPFGCTPAVVRTDLLEENDVQVLCQLSATQINPLIDVQTIDSISFSGSYPKEISGIGFHPARAALGVEGDLNSPVLNNIGYIKINLKKQSNSSALPNCHESIPGIPLSEVCTVEGNLTARIKYNIKNALGIGKALIYLPELATQEDWEKQNYKYSFWNERGTLQAESVSVTNAQIAVYSNGQKISGVNLKKGETSDMIYLPGMQCQAGLKLKLEDLESPTTRAIINVNSEVVEVAVGEKFLDSKCSVTNIKYDGINQMVSLRCTDDRGVIPFDLSINPKITLTINGVSSDYSVGDWLYDQEASFDLLSQMNVKRSVYLGYVGTIKNSKNPNDLFVFLVSLPDNKKERLSQEELSTASTISKMMNLAGISSSGTVGKFDDAFKIFGGAGVLAWRAFERGELYHQLYLFDDFQTIFGSSVAVVGFTGAQDVPLAGNALEYYEGARENYGALEESYSSEIYKKSEDLTFGEEAFYKEILLMWNSNQKRTAAEMCQEFMRAYPKSNKKLDFCNDAIKLANQEIQEVSLTVNGEVKVVSFEGIDEPNFQDYGVVVRVNTPQGEVKEFDLRKNSMVFLDKDQEIFSLSSDANIFYFKYSDLSWYWSSNRVDWASSPDTSGFPQLISQLRGKSYQDGATILKNQGATSSMILSQDYLQFISADENSARISTNVQVYGLMSTIAKEFSNNEITLVKDVPKDLGTGYIFTLTEINLKRIAKVSVIPNINEAGTEANFSFKIGIEKRAIDLPPETTRKLISGLDKTINTWEGISGFLGNATKIWQGACLSVGTLLVAKNFFTGLTGEGLARQTVMRGTNGWTERCTNLVADKNYSTLDECYVKNSAKIDKDVNQVSDLIEAQNKKIKELEKGITSQPLLSETVVDTNAFMEKYISQTKNCLAGKTFSDPSGKNDAISSSDLNLISYDLWKNSKTFDTEQLRNIELYCQVLKSSTSEELKQIASKRLYTELYDIKINSATAAELNTLANNLRVSPEQITFIEEGNNVKKFPYENLLNNGNIPGVRANAPIAIVTTSKGNKYILLLNDSAGIKQLPVQRIYSTSGTLIMDYSVASESPASYADEIVQKVPAELQNIYFQRYDAKSYQNTYKRALLRYYETAPYQGLPAIVPFDLKNGWYAGIKQTLPVGGNIASYEESGRVSSFFLCNVGENGLEEFQTIGGDICEMINTGTGMPYNNFPGLNERDSKTQVDKAVQAITQASKIPTASRKGTVSILGNKVQVGSPAADIPQFQCQDFMSPSDCLLMFNVCDPVICPASRCNLGGAYPVKDVVQTGIIGSLVLCLPNAKEGIAFPICLTGVQAGVDGFLSLVLYPYRDCLKEKLATGKVVGICDETFSVYFCDFFWGQASPLTNLVIPTVVEFVLGQKTRGGGEYATFENTWSLTEKSVGYFMDFYGANTKQAFLTRTTELVKNEFCKSFVSTVVPTSADFVNNLITPASPVQFTGRFDEIPMSTATVPPISHYKVSYRIFAGKDSGAYYKVYLRGSSQSSYYEQASNDLIVASGYIPVGQYVDGTPDLTAVSGYDQMCINVNGQEECGFKQVSTDFAVNYIKDQYLASQASKQGITTTTECISGTPSIYGLSPNLQEAVENSINPEIYNQGITRICATENPGLGTDTSPYMPTRISGFVVTTNKEEVPPETAEPVEETPEGITTEEIPPEEVIEELTENPGVNDGPRYVQVGYCDNEKVKCWLDTQSVKDVIKTTTVEGDALEDITKSYLNVLLNEGNYISKQEFNSTIKAIESEKDSGRKITLIDNIFDRVFWNNEKAMLILLKGNAFADLLTNFLATQEKPTTVHPVGFTDKAEILELTDARQRVLAAAALLEGTIVPGKGVREPKPNRNCLSAIRYIFYDIAQVGFECVYSDRKGDSYKLPAYGNRVVTICDSKKPEVNHPTWISQCADASCGWNVCGDCSKLEILKEDKLDKLQPGDFILYVFKASDPTNTAKTDDYDHGAIFIEWVDKAKHQAKLFDLQGYSNGHQGFYPGQTDKNGKVCGDGDYYHYDDWNGPKDRCLFYRYFVENISDNAHPVYVYHAPYLDGEKKPSTANKLADNTLTTSEVKDEVPSDSIPLGTIGSTASTFVGQSILPVQMVVNSLDNLKIASKEMKDSLSSKDPVLAFSLAIDSDPNFKEIEPGLASTGDILFFGNGCNIPYTVGILENDFYNVVVSSGQVTQSDVSFYGNFDNSKLIKLEKIDILELVTMPNLVTSGSKETKPKDPAGKYPYRAYRYVGGLSEEAKKKVYTERVKWTLDSALNEINSRISSSNYIDVIHNFDLFLTLTWDGILTNEECLGKKEGSFLSYSGSLLTLKSLLEKKKSESTGSVIGNKIYAEAVKLGGASKTNLGFITSVLTNSGIQSFSPTSPPSSVESLINVLDKDKNFVKITNSQFKRGDILLLGYGCTKDKIGVFANTDFLGVDLNDMNNLDLAKSLFYYGSYKDKVGKYSLDYAYSITDIWHSYSGYTELDASYVYAAYRYVGDLSTEEKAKILPPRQVWTLNNAIAKIFTLTGTYSDNKQFVDELFFDGILTQKECEKVQGWIGGIGQSSIKDITAILTKKSSTLIEESVSSKGKTIYEEASKLVGSFSSSLKFVLTTLSNSGLQTFSLTKSPPSSVSALIKVLDTHPDFVRISDSNFKNGDLVLVGVGCSTENIGIFAGYTDENLNSFYFYTSAKDASEGVVKMISSKAYTIVDTVYLYGGYRYVGDLSAEEKAEIPKPRAKWTVATAVDKIKPASPTTIASPLTGKYSDNKQFVDELIFDGLLTEQECKTVRGGLWNFGQKDIGWVKAQILLEK